MAYGRARRASSHEHFWPGYVDVLSTLLLVVTFLLSIFMVAQFYVSQEAGSKDDRAAPASVGSLQSSPACSAWKRARANHLRTSWLRCRLLLPLSRRRTSG